MYVISKLCCYPDLGLIYVTFSMLGSAAVPMVHEHVITTYNVSVDDLTYHSFLGSTVVSLVLAIATHEFMQVSDSLICSFIVCVCMNVCMFVCTNEESMYVCMHVCSRSQDLNYMNV